MSAKEVPDGASPDTSVSSHVIRLVGIAGGQVLIAAVSVVVTISASRSLSPAQFGAVALAWGMCQVGVSCIRLGFGVPLAVSTLHPRPGATLALAGSVGALFGCIACAIAVVSGVDPLICLGLALATAGLVILDAVRTFAAKLDWRRLPLILSDGAFLATGATALVALTLSGLSTLPAALLSVAAASLASTAIALARVRGSKGQSLRSWLHDHAQPTRHGLSEWLVTSAAGQGALIITSLVASVAVVGSMRLGQLFWAPLTLILSAVPVAAGRAFRGDARTRGLPRSPAVRATLAIEASMLALTVAALVVLASDSALSIGLLGSSGPSGVVCAFTLVPAAIAGIVMLNYSIRLKATDRPEVVARLRWLLAPLELTLVPLGAATLGYVGAGIGYSVAAVTVSSALIAAQFRGSTSSTHSAKSAAVNRRGDS